MSDDYADLPEDERPLGLDKAKERAARLLTDPKFTRAKGHRDDDRTRDDDMSDPELNAEEEEVTDG